MSQSHRISLSALGIAGVVIGLQWVRIHQLREEVATVRAESGVRLVGEVAVRGPAGSGRVASEIEDTASEAAVGGDSLPGSGSLGDILAHPDPAERLQRLLDYVNRLPSSMLREAVMELQNSSPEWDPEAKMVLHMMVTRWAREEPEAAYASLETLGPKNRSERASSILASLAAADPQRAAAWLASPDNKLVDFPFMGLILAGTVGKEWMRQDTEGALAWAAGLPDSQRPGAHVGILGTLAGSDPRRAAGLAAGLAPGEARHNIMAEIGAAWARKAPEEAAAWVQTLEAADRPAALRKTVASWAEREPQAAAAFLQSLPKEEMTGDLLKSVAEPWTARAPTEAASWVMNQPEGKARDEAIGGVVWNWTKQDPVAASTWLHDQPVGPARDAAIGGLALAAFDNDPAGAVTWAAQLSDETKRSSALTLGLTEWLKRDRPSATAWARERGMALPEVK